MMRWLRWALLLAALALGALLGQAHSQIRSVAPPVPTRAQLDELFATPGGPVSVRYVNTASQQLPDVGEGAHPGFLLDWQDGRAFLIDVGMDRPGAVEFGKPMEWVFGADPAVAHGSVGEQMGEDAKRIGGVAFTHLHLDHTGGMRELCEAVGHEVPIYQTGWQFELTNFTTEMGADDLRASGCARETRLEGEPPYAIPGFPGLFAIGAGGHTPGSTIYLVRVGETNWILAGDVSNSKPNLLADIPKQLVYSLVIVPEYRARLGELRRWLAALDADPSTEVVVSHDGKALQATGMDAY